MNQNGALSRIEPYSYVSLAVQIAPLGVPNIGPAAAGAGNKPCDAVIVTIAAASQHLDFVDQNTPKGGPAPAATVITFPLTGVFVLPISPAAIINTTTAAQVLLAFC